MDITKLKEVIQKATDKKDIYRLADVLLTLQPNETIATNTEKGTLISNTFAQVLTWWEWKDDNLDNQSEETKEFLNDLLVK